MASIPTRTVRVRATGTMANINVKDFDPKLHEEPTFPVDMAPERPAQTQSQEPDRGAQADPIPFRRNIQKKRSAANADG